MNHEEHKEFLEYILLRTQWQKLTPRHKPKAKAQPETYIVDPVLERYRNGEISKAGVCKYLGIEEKDLLRTLTEKGELF